MMTMELKNYLLENEYLKLEVLNIGCAIHRLWVKDASGKFRLAAAHFPSRSG